MGASRDVEDRKEIVTSPRCEITRSTQSGGVVLYAMIAISFAKTPCLSPVPSKSGSSKRRLENVSSLFCNKLVWALSGHHNILLILRYTMGLMV